MPEEPIGLKAVLKAIETKTANIEDIVDIANRPEEFNLKFQPVAEMGQISILLNEGVSCQEILALVKAGELPTLTVPEMQWPMIEIIEKLGQTAIVSQVIVEESALGLKDKELDSPESIQTTESAPTLETATVSAANTGIGKLRPIFYCLFVSF